MSNDQNVIDNLDDLRRFLVSVETGGLGLQGVEGVGMATNNADGRHFVAVFDANHKLLHARWITDEVYETGKEMVRDGVRGQH
ncbi:MULTISPECIES: hypothetical protein [Shewanella]|uniref:Uncharacterized protein n=1 Tax=Shewanella fidelis TaxID=173509 RepID=A0AAW8NIL5_9GAMM|nr:MULTISPECIES: hypothetical protein [Shewanella]MDR8522712.1 hypothetical protein [Shewanella fidelis]MDW4812327.1 hypothetical protein [Shewanella fidelis]MDW4816008.1 hypothetical protein [Shewanella fidelis]MDW4820568.1 hypothetical protein [Shewanella fidelis]MDW4824791.1 hypothetical protein [Shewanella fidelis]